MKPVGVIFDMDGVLVDSAASHLDSWVELGRRRDLRIAPDFFRSTFGCAGRDMVRTMLGRAADDDEVRDLVETKEEIYREMIRGRVPLTEGVAKVVVDLWNAGYRLAVGTSGPLANVELVLAEAEIADCFTQIVTGFDVEAAKPAPDVFELAAARIDVAPQRCVVIEDAPVGIEAARAAGMPSIGLTGMHDAATLMSAGAGRVVDRIATITPGFVDALISD